jgi:hypothetical protein
MKSEDILTSGLLLRNLAIASIASGALLSSPFLVGMSTGFTMVAGTCFVVVLAGQ